MTYSREYLEKMNAEAISRCSPKHIESVIAELISTASAQAVPDAVRDVLAERRRQVEAEGFKPEHDDQHDGGELALAAACYALACDPPHGRSPNNWPWSESWWKPADDRRNLVKAGALILAEIERLDRAALRASTPADDSQKGGDEPLLTSCAAARDGDCTHAKCPQLRDGEPTKTGRYCPLDKHD